MTRDRMGRICANRSTMVRCQASLLAAASQWAKGPMTDAFYSEDSLDIVPIVGLGLQCGIIR
jgi:hypothetical protein